MTKRIAAALVLATVTVLSVLPAAAAITPTAEKDNACEMLRDGASSDSVICAYKLRGNTGA